MNRELSHKLLVNQYRSYASLLSEKGIPFEEFPSEELESMPDIDLKLAVRIVRDLARTPTQ